MKRRERERVRLQVLLGQVLLGQVRTERHQYSHTSTTFVRGISFVNKGRLRFFQASVLLCILDLYTGRHISVVIRYIFGYFLTTMFIYTHPYNIYSITRRHRLHPLLKKKKKSSLQLPSLTKQFKLNLLLHRNGRSSASPSHSSLQERTTPRRVSSSDACV